MRQELYTESSYNKIAPEKGAIFVNSQERCDIMVLRLFDCKADMRRVNKLPYMTEKHATDIYNAQYNLDIITPTFIVNYVADFPLHCNYAYCPDLNRYYFITSMTEDPGTSITLHCEVDVRMSFLNDNDFPVVVTRNEFMDKNDNRDESLPIRDNENSIKVMKYANEIFAKKDGSPQQYDIIETI